MIFRYAGMRGGELQDAKYLDDEKHGHKHVESEGGPARTGGSSIADAEERKDALESCLAQLEFGGALIRSLLKQYPSSDENKQSVIGLHSFCSFLKIKVDPIAERMFNLFDFDESDTINMKEFMVSISNYAADFKTEDKIKFAFQIFDVDNSNHLSRDELQNILKANYMAPSVDENIKRKANAVFNSADIDNSGDISLEEFVVVANKFPSLLFPLSASMQ
jgi:serine/threonine-protein phosphatase 2B regulatory subunit